MISQSNLFIVPGRQDWTSHHVIKVLVDTLSTWSKAYVVGPVVDIGTDGWDVSQLSSPNNMYFTKKMGKDVFPMAKLFLVVFHLWCIYFY